MPSVLMDSHWVERVNPLSGEREEWFDTKILGLGLRVSPGGRKTWFVRYRVYGEDQKRRLTLKPYPVMSLAEARKAAQAVLTAASKGLDPAGEKQEEKRAPTFADLAKEYMERHAKIKKRSWKKDENSIAKDLLPIWGRMKVHEIRRRDVILLLDSIADRGSPIQANRTLALVRKIFNFGVSRDWLDVNPCSQVKPVSDENQRDRVLAPNEIRALWEALGKLDPVVGASFMLQLLTAQRGGEVKSMRWADFDLDGAWWTVPAIRSKNKLAHRVPLSKPAMTILLRLKEVNGDQEWVFASPLRKGQPLRYITNSALKLRELSGVEDFVPHDLRRTAASYMASMGVPRLVISKILNHVEPGITRVYDRHSYDAEKREALERWATYIEDLLKENSQRDGSAGVASVSVSLKASVGF